jgi:hypothetical protein
MTLVSLIFMAIVRFFDLGRIFRPSSCTRIWYCFKPFPHRCKRRQHDDRFFYSARRTHSRMLTSAVRLKTPILCSYHTATPNTPHRTRHTMNKPHTAHAEPPIMERTAQSYTAWSYTERGNAPGQATPRRTPNDYNRRTLASC